MKKRFNTNLRKLFVLVFMTTSTLITVNAQNCNCNHTIPLGTTVVNGDLNSLQSNELYLPIQSGDTVCIQAGTYSNLTLKNISGSSTNKVIFKNCGGLVRIGYHPYFHSLHILNSKFFQLTGTGDANYEFGILIDVDSPIRTDAAPSGLAIESTSSDYEVDHLEITNTPFAGIIAKADPLCYKPENWRRNFVAKNLSFHDLNIHDVAAEGIYVGYTGNPVTCDGETVYPHLIEGLKIYNVTTNNTGWDGIQVNRVSQDCEIYENKITNYGLENEIFQNTGIHLGIESVGKIYNNLVDTGTGMGIEIKGIGDVSIYNNIVLNTGAVGIYANDSGASTGRGSYRFMHNTVINTKSFGIRMINFKDGATDYFYNNIILNSEETYFNSNKDYLYIARNQQIDSTANLMNVPLSTIQFVDTIQKDFRLRDSSPLKNTGHNIQNFAIPFDFEGKSRIIEGTSDIGAYEHELIINPALPTTNLTTNLCGNTSVDMNALVWANAVPNASSYLFNIENENTGEITALKTDVRFFKFKDIANVTYGTKYKVKVAAIVNGIEQTNYGTVCTVTTETLPTTQLTSAYCNTTNWSPTQELWAERLDAVSAYEYHVTNNTTNETFTIQTTLDHFNLAQSNATIYYNCSYAIKVRGIDLGGNPGPWGATCTVTLKDLSSVAQLANTSCGASKVIDETLIWINEIPGVEKFEVTVSNTATNYNETITIYDRFFKPKNLPNPLERGTTYNISVKAFTPIIDATGNSCTIETLAIPTTQIASWQCGKTNVGHNDIIWANNVPQAEAYRFLIQNNSIPFETTYETTSRFFKVKDVGGMSYGTTYEISVGTVIGTSVAYGAPCNITTIDHPLTNLTSTSCNATQVGLSQTLFAEKVPMAESYEFLVENTAIGYSSTVVRTNDNFRLVWLSQPITQEGDYQVSVRTTVGGATSNYGTVCTISVEDASLSSQTQNLETITINFDNNENVIIDTPKELLLYNSLGQLVLSKKITQSKESLRFDYLPKGLYYGIINGTEPFKIIIP